MAPEYMQHFPLVVTVAIGLVTVVAGIVAGGLGR